MMTVSLMPHWYIEERPYDDTSVADWLGHIWKTRLDSEGNRETYDPVAGLWRGDTDLASAWRARKKGRKVFGSSASEGERVAVAMTRAGL